MEILMDTWQAVDEERSALADDLATLDDGQWDAQSLCSEWKVRHVVGHLIGGRFLFRNRKVRARRSIGFHNSLRKKIPNRLALLRYIGGENVIEAAVLTNDDDDMFDRRGGIAVS